jgi:hypothetical protein
MVKLHIYYPFTQLIYHYGKLSTFSPVTWKVLHFLCKFRHYFDIIPKSVIFWLGIGILWIEVIISLLELSKRENMSSTDFCTVTYMYICRFVSPICSFSYSPSFNLINAQNKDPDPLSLVRRMLHVALYCTYVVYFPSPKVSQDSCPQFDRLQPAAARPF